MSGRAAIIDDFAVFERCDLLDLGGFLDDVCYTAVPL